jgi:lipopolysaccharide/colanic/teichoic acid biosynthesis glycosyltransferase
MTRRLIDVVVAVLAALVLLPVGLVVGMVVRRNLGAPVLFRQTRVGRDGREFSIVKFRTMRGESWPGEPDAARDCRAGRMLRGLSLDELPQLWNVVVGDMSLIGPRPTLPEQVRCYSERQMGRLSVRPGLTGWAQVNGRNSISWPDRIELDLQYIEKRSLVFDLLILWRTIVVLVRRSDIYGEGGVNQGFPVDGENVRP